MEINQAWARGDQGLRRGVRPAPVGARLPEVVDVSVMTAVVGGKSVVGSGVKGSFARRKRSIQLQFKATTRAPPIHPLSVHQDMPLPPGIGPVCDRPNDGARGLMGQQRPRGKWQGKEC